MADHEAVLTCSRNGSLQSRESAAQDQPEDEGVLVQSQHCLRGMTALASVCRTAMNRVQRGLVPLAWDAAFTLLSSLATANFIFRVASTALGCEGVHRLCSGVEIIAS